jgi:hypothetical protein
MIDGRSIEGSDARGNAEVLPSNETKMKNLRLDGVLIHLGKTEQAKVKKICCKEGGKQKVHNNKKTLHIIIRKNLYY